LKEFLSDQLPPNHKADYVVREGKAHKEIVDYAKESQTDLIVIATHGLTGLDYILLGSTAEKVVRSAGCPVLTVKIKV
jgi:nucleotide-binding universal stress UspA family protein